MQSMATENGQQERAEFKSRLGFVLAAAGSAVGLGNIWKFPYITGENGGGLFVLIYLVCIVLVGIPIMVAEIMIGRAAQKQPVAAFHAIQGKRTPWAGVGWLGVLTGFVILSYYIVVAGWSMDYTLKSVVNFTKDIHHTAETEGTKYRASTKPDQMRKTLAGTKGETDAKRELAEIRSQVRPSIWKETYPHYLAGLEAAQAVDVAKQEAVKEVWADESPDVLDYFGLADSMNVPTSREDREHYATVRKRLFEKVVPGGVFQEEESFGDRVKEAEKLLVPLERTRKKHLLAARRHYEKLSDKQVRDEAEDLHRRALIFDEVKKTFVEMASDGWTATFWAAVFMFITTIIVSRGISGGIERTCQILMPTMIVLILIMVIYGATRAGFGQALAFVFQPDVSKLKASGVLEALGHAFFTLSLGMGAMITYGSYQRSKTGLVGQSVTIASLDTVIALMACLMMFPIIFTYGQEPSAGPGLVFMSMPLAFSEMGSGGMLLAIIFFGLLGFAALTSAISLLEVVVSYFIDEHDWSRTKAAWILGGVVFLFALPSAFSLDPEAMMSGWEPSFGKNFFDTMDYLASNWMLPLGGLLIAIYAGWVMPRRLRRAEFGGVPAALFSGWLFLICIVAPALVVLILLQKVGILDIDELLHGLF